ncbi:putative receptor-like protein kinase [Hordeum vulgare]|nr:putative receptor-like protein kinase [Hordeum vulgare]
MIGYLDIDINGFVYSNSLTTTPVSSVRVVTSVHATPAMTLNRSRPVREQTLADWAFPLLSQRKKVLGIVDPRLAADDYPVKAVHKTAMLAYHCLSRNPKARPLMRNI